MQQFVKYSRTIERLPQGSLSEYIGLCAPLLKQQGYSRALVQSRILLIRRFSRWLERNGIGTYTIDACTLQRFLRDYKRKRRVRGDAAALARFLVLLRQLACRSGSVHLVWSARSRLSAIRGQTGLRLSEMTGLKREDLILGAGAHLRVIGKGRRERCIPLAKSTLAVLKAWLREPQRGDGHVLFPSAKGERLSVHGVQYLLTKHRMAASKVCPSLKEKRVTVHRLRHTMAMDLLQAGVDRSVIALWLRHESVETTKIYLEATLAMKERALAKTLPSHGRPGRYQPGDQLLGFLNSVGPGRWPGQNWKGTSVP